MRLALVLLLLLAACAPTGSVKPERSLELQSAKPLRSHEQKPPKLSTPSPSTSEALIFTGSGTNTTDVFTLVAGDYLVRWEVSGGSDCFYTVELEPIGHDEIVALPAAGFAPSTGSATQDLAGGDYAFDITSDCHWTVSIEPR